MREIAVYEVTVHCAYLYIAILSNESYSLDPNSGEEEELEMRGGVGDPARWSQSAGS